MYFLHYIVSYRYSKFFIYPFLVDICDILLSLQFNTYKIEQRSVKFKILYYLELFQVAEYFCLKNCLIFE